MKDKWHADKSGAYLAKRHYADWVLYSDVLCLLCGRHWEVNVSSFKLDKGCPKCKPDLFATYKRTRYVND